MRVIYKYPIRQPSTALEIEMPEGAEVLTVQTQRGVPCIWAIVDLEEPVEKREFAIFPTGLPLDIGREEWRYVGSFQMENETLIFHLFEKET